MTTLMVAVGGTLGVMARYGIGRATLHHEALLWSTVGINVIGSFLLGLLVAEHWFDRDLREGLGVGFLGGFTTFSTFSVQVVLDVDAGQAGRAAAYLVASVVGGIAAAACGYVLGRKLAA
jgi:fluoride exporter